MRSPLWNGECGMVNSEFRMVNYSELLRVFLMIEVRMATRSLAFSTLAPAEVPECRICFAGVLFVLGELSSCSLSLIILTEKSNVLFGISMSMYSLFHIPYSSFRGRRGGVLGESIMPVSGFAHVCGNSYDDESCISDDVGNVIGEYGAVDTAVS